jgi:flagellar hook protein FlgE
MPNVKLNYTEDAIPDPSWSGSFSEESKLKRLGYSVQQADGMSDGERQSLLNSIIRTGQMTDAEVTNHLEMLIHLNSGKTNMTNACGCWKADLKFVQDNFGDMRKQKDFYSSGEKAQRSSSTTKKSTTATSNTSTQRKTTSSSKATSTSKKTTKKSDAAAKAAKRKKALEERRDFLQAELVAATGLFNIFKRHRIKNELQEVENAIRRL